MANTCIVILGPPGAGKGTQLRRVAEALPDTVSYIDFGQCVREYKRAEGELGERIRSELKDMAQKRQEVGVSENQRLPGTWFSNELCVMILDAAVSQIGGDTLVMLDGFPRKLDQAMYLQESPNWRCVGAAHVNISREEVETRLRSRWIHQRSGRTYAGPGTDTLTGDMLVRREEDNSDSVAARLEDYHTETTPVLSMYREEGMLTTVNGGGTAEEVTAELTQIVLNAVSACER